MNKPLRGGGFTLIELLTVIAIISILAAMVIVGAPRLLMKAKIASQLNNFNQIRTACVTFFTKNKETYPPAYGYKVWNTDPNAEVKFHLEPYVAKIGYFGVTDMYDLFSTSHDTDMDNHISLLEFSPLGQSSGPNSVDFPTVVYDGSNLENEVNRQAGAQRPIIYIPVSMKQAAVVAQYYYDLGGDDGAYARRWAALPNATAKNDVTKLKFPPNKYDDYVLISVGPSGSTGGIVGPPPDSFLSDMAANADPSDIYHILALRAYFLATRDWDDDKMLDFDFNTRKPSSGGARILLPDGTNGQGPLIYHRTQA